MSHDNNPANNEIKFFKTLTISNIKIGEFYQLYIDNTETYLYLKTVHFFKIYAIDICTYEC